MTTTQSVPRLGRRHLFRAAGAGAAGAVLAGGGRSEPGPQPGSPSAAPAGGFPVTVEGVEGPTTLDAPPPRIVSVGQYRDTDAAVALGVVPLATPDLAPMVPGGVTPWRLEALGSRPAPTLLRTTDGLPVEQIAALRPDLVLATDYSELSASYDTLTGIAPTLSTASGYNRDTWQVTTTRVGAVLGRAQQATELIARVEGAVRAATEQNPGFSGRTFTIGPVQADGLINTINSDTDASVRFLSHLGLRLSPGVSGLAPGNFPGRAVVSPEQLDRIDADVMVLTYTSPVARTRLEADPLFRRLPAVRRGAYIALDLTTAISMAFPSALSIPYALRQSVPRIADALTR